MVRVSQENRCMMSMGETCLQTESVKHVYHIVFVSFSEVKFARHKIRPKLAEPNPYANVTIISSQ